MIALLEAKAAGLWSRSQRRPNLIAGLIVGVVALPLAMAFAIASGARAVIAGFTAGIGVIVFVGQWKGFATGIFAIEEIIHDFRRHGATMLQAELRSNVQYKLERAGILGQLGRKAVSASLEQALDIAKQLRTSDSTRAVWKPLSSESEGNPAAALSDLQYR